MCRHSLTFYGSCDIPACNLTFYDVNLLSNINFPGEFEDGRSLFDLIRLKDDLEALLGRSVHVVTEKAVHPRIRGNIVRKSIGL